MHELLRKTMKDGVVPAADSPRLAGLVEDLAFMRRRCLRATSENWEIGKYRHKKLAEGLAALGEALPALVEDYERAKSWAEEDENKSAEQNFALGAKLLQSLALAAAGVQLCPLFHEHPEHPLEVRWENYGQPIIETLEKNVPGMGDEAHYRFIAAVAPAITGESVTPGAVKTAVLKGRLVNWCN